MSVKFKERVKKAATTVKHEFFEMLPPTIFFFIAFCLLNITQKLVLRQYDIPFHGIGVAIIVRIVTGKQIGRAHV